MRKILVILLLTTSFIQLQSQNVFPEKFDCNVDVFGLDWGEQKAEVDIKNFLDYLMESINQKHLVKLDGVINIQIIVDTLGNPCCKSILNNSNIRTNKLKLVQIINSMPNWSPAIQEGKKVNSSIQMALIFKDSKLTLQRLNFDFSKAVNQSSVGKSQLSNKQIRNQHFDLSEEWKVYNKGNSALPWDMTRSVAIDRNNNAWIGTDNGMVKIFEDSLKVYNSSNSPIIKNKTGRTGITTIAIDIYDNKWFSDWINIYMHNNSNNEWLVFDTINTSFIGDIYADNYGSVWVCTHNGLLKYSNNEWSKIDTSNSEIVSNRISGVFVDSKKRLWIGTYEGNSCIIDNKSNDAIIINSPLKDASITKVYEDKEGNLWFDVYCEDNPYGLLKLDTLGTWSKINKDNSKLPSNIINDFVIDEVNQIIWFGINQVGIVKYSLQENQWTYYTPENSNVPSVEVMDLGIDSEGNLWAATLAGVVYMKKNNKF